LTACVEKEKGKAYCLPSDTKTVTRAKQHNNGKEKCASTLACMRTHKWTHPAGTGFKQNKLKMV